MEDHEFKYLSCSFHFTKCTLSSFYYIVPGVPFPILYTADLKWAILIMLILHGLMTMYAAFYIYFHSFHNLKICVHVFIQNNLCIAD